MSFRALAALIGCQGALSFALTEMAYITPEDELRDFHRIGEQPPTLSIGAHGYDAQQLNVQLVQLGYLPGGHATTVFNWATDTALRNFQADCRLVVDGIYGPLTRRAMTERIVVVCFPKPVEDPNPDC